MTTLRRKTTLALALGTLTALAAPFGPTAAQATHENYKGSEVLCYIKTGDSFRCWHMGP